MFKIPFDDDHDMFPEIKFSGRGLWVAPTDSKQSSEFKYPRGKVIVINRTDQMVRGYENGDLKFTFEAVLGNIMKRTPPGCDHIVSRKKPEHTSGEYGTPMNWSVFFIWQRGIALHQYHGDTSPAAWQRMRRRQAVEGSAGCVRLKEADAKAVYDFAVENKTKVWVVDKWPEHGGCISPGDFLDLILKGVRKLQGKE